jgi:hypothetical protein
MTALPVTALTRLAPAPTDVKPLRRRPVLAKAGHPTVRPDAAAHLSDDDVAELGRSSTRFATPSWPSAARRTPHTSVA